MLTRGVVVSLLALGSLPLACGSAAERPSPTADLPGLEGLEPDPARLPSAEPPPAPGPGVRLRHLLVRYQGSVGAARSLRRTREEARQRSEHLLRLARSRQHDLGELARRHSDDSRTSSREGELGWLAWGESHPALEAAARGLQPGQVAGPVESPSGFHLLQRLPLETFQAGEIVVTYEGAQRYQTRRPRDRDEAARLAAAIHARLSAGASFEEEALAWSDAPEHLQGGLLRPFGPGQAHPRLEELVRGLPESGGLSEVLETSVGFRILARFPLARARCRVLGLEVKDGPDVPPAERRPAQAALELAAELRRRALAPNADFAALVAAHSEHETRARGGELTLEGRGRFSPELERRVFALAEGELSAPFVTGHMVYLVRRIPFQPWR
jgi:parvulin-like peptidyl-prolyl isomerase